jgi:hypothetical protein
MSTWTNALCFVAGDTTIEAWQPTTETAPTTSYPFTPQAVLDRSLNPLTVVPAVPKGTKAWETLQTIAAAELGYIRKDANGIIRFTNRQTILGAAPAATSPRPSRSSTSAPASRRPGRPAPSTCPTPTGTSAPALPCGRWAARS